MRRSAVWLGWAVSSATAVLVAMAAPGVAVETTIVTTTTTTASSITVVGATNGALALTSSGPSFTGAVALRAGGGITEATVSVTPFRDQAGETFNTEPASTKVTFTNGAAIVQVTAPLPFGGPFSAELTVAAGQVSQRVVLNVTRTRGATPVTVDGVESQTAVSVGWGRRTVHRQITITETNARKLTTEPLAIVTPSTALGELTTGADLRLVKVEVPPGSKACAVSGRSVTIEAGASCPLTLQIAAPGGVGSYAGSIRVVAAGFSPVDHRIKVQLRLHWAVALLFILVGVVLAALLRNVLVKRRETLGVRIDIAQARDDLQAAAGNLPPGPGDAEERRQLKGLHALLDRADDDARGNRATEAKARLTRARKQIASFRAWVTLHRAFVAAEPEVRERLRERWERLSGELVDPTLVDARADKLADDLESLRKDLASGARARVMEEVNRFAATLPGLGLGDRAKPVDDLIAAAKAEATSEQGLPAAAAHHLLRAQALAADTIADRIEEFVDADVGTLGFTVRPEWWSTFGARITDQLRDARGAEPAKKLDLLHDAELDLLDGVSSQFRRAAAASYDRLKASQAPNDQRAAELLKPVLDALDNARQAVKEKKVADAHAAYEQARTAAQAVKANNAQHLGATSAADIVALPGAALGAIAALIAAPPESLPETPVREGRSSLERKLGKVEVTLILLAVLVAVIAGLATLYGTKSTWGSLGDLTTALLWGFGISTAANGVAGYGGAYEALTK